MLRRSTVFIAVCLVALFGPWLWQRFTRIPRDMNPIERTGLYSPSGVAAAQPLVRQSAVDVQSHGAAGDGVTDDTAAILTAARAIRDNTDSTPLFLPSGTYRITSSLDLTHIRNIVCEGEILADCSGPAVIVGGRSLYYANMLLRVRHSGPSSRGDVGVQVHGLYMSEIHFNDVSGFDINVQLLADDKSRAVYYNTFYLNSLIGATTCAVDVYGVNGVTCNENLYIGGRLNGNYGIRIGAAAGTPNGNVFIKPCIEAAGVAAVRIERGENNYFYDVRDELTPVGLSVADAGTSTCNLYVSGYTSPAMREDAPATWGESYNQAVRRSHMTYRWETVADVDFARAYVADGRLHVPAPVSLVNVRDHTRVMSEDVAVINRGVVNLGCYPDRALGVFVRTDNFHDFIMEAKGQSVNAANLGNFRVVCYDADNHVLSGADPYYVQNISGISVSTPGGYVRSQHFSSKAQSQILHFHTDVKKAFIGLSGHGADGYSSGFRLRVGCSSDPAAAAADILIPANHMDCPVAVSGPEETLSHLVAPVAPTQGWFEFGDRVHDSANPFGTFVCTSRVDTQVVNGLSAGGTRLYVRNNTGIQSGDVIGVQMDNKVVHWSVVEGAPGGDPGKYVTLADPVPANRCLDVNAAVWTMRWTTQREWRQ